MVNQENNKVFVLSDYGKGTLMDTKLIIRRAKAKRKKLFLIDPKGKDFSKYVGADLITPNLNEFMEVVGKIASEKELTKKGKNLIKSLKLKALLITRGPDGMTLLENKNNKIIDALITINKLAFVKDRSTPASLISGPIL